MSGLLCLEAVTAPCLYKGWCLWSIWLGNKTSKCWYLTNQLPHPLPKELLSSAFLSPSFPHSLAPSLPHIHTYSHTLTHNPWPCLPRHLILECGHTQSRIRASGRGLRTLCGSEGGGAWGRALNKMSQFGDRARCCCRNQTSPLVFFHLRGRPGIQAASGRAPPWHYTVWRWLKTLPCCPFPGNKGHLSHIGATSALIWALAE